MKIGDVVITSGYGLFPENLKVGVISEVSNDQPGMFKKVKIQTSVDFQKLEEVFVLLTHPPSYLVN